MFKTKNFGRLSLTVDTKLPQTWWPPMEIGKYAIWLSLGPWLTACWQRDR